jgi:hypothetical protein
MCVLMCVVVGIGVEYSETFQKRDSISALMSDVMALQASHHVTAREDLIREFQTRLSALRASNLIA